MAHRIAIFFFFILLGCSCETDIDIESFPYTFHLKNTNAESHYRGLSAPSDSVCWISGTNGTILKTSNAGKSWKKLAIPGHETSDLRDIEAFDDQSAVVMAIGSPAKIFRTNNGGKTWWLTYFNDHPDIFLDGIAFFNEKEGLAFGDAISNKIIILQTYDGGNSWSLIPELRLPDAITKEGGFAASGTSIIAHGENEAYIGLGFPRGRLIYSHDKGHNWDFYLTGLGNGDTNRGVYSLDFNSNGFGVAVGGDWSKPDNHNLVAATTLDKGLHWEIVTENPPNGYRSAVKFIPNTEWLIATGPNGTDYSNDKGLNWNAAKTGGANSIAFSPSGQVGWMAGNKGRIVKITPNQESKED
ncbi:MAG: hypothetical protein CL840_14085 [Crocinitomicaceae bacterium]|nr:hypothetical protein [Crocinitomicaceae bacterium]|tara:strand:- start:4546 stop:5613 length:1068 start_codon:yes stop_codon:yes gene_type:complete